MGNKCKKTTPNANLRKNYEVALRSSLYRQHITIFKTSNTTRPVLRSAYTKLAILLAYCSLGGAIQYHVLERYVYMKHRVSMTEFCK